MKPGVCVLGLGGTSISLLKPWAESGWLPNLDYLFRHGMSGPLVSPVPPAPIPEWAAILTGKNPGHTGFFDQVQKKTVSYFPDRTRFSSLSTGGMWNLLNRFDRGAALVNIPFVGEPPEIAQMIGPHRVAMNDRNAFSLFEKRARHAGLLSGGEDRAGSSRAHAGPGRTLSFIEKVTFDTIALGRILELVMETGKVDFLGVNFDGPDRILSRFWEEIVSLGKNGPVSAVEEAILLFFKVLDDVVGKLSLNMGPEDLFVVLSSHGYGPFRKFLSLNHFLSSQGLLSFRKGKGGKSHASRFASPFLRAMGIRREPLKRVLGKLGIDGWLERFAPPFSSEIGLFNWGMTRAFSIARNGIYLNIRGVEPSGMVNPGKEAKALGNDIIRKLHELTDPETGDSIIYDARWRDDLYDGPRLGDLPHLVIHNWNPAYTLADFDCNWEGRGVFSGTNERNGSSNKEGFFLMAGAGLSRGSTSESPLSIFDIAPAILKKFDGELPVWMEGLVHQNNQSRLAPS
ncbi:MAG: alkaline phosphatase family protein [Leptospirales bacterium]